MLRRLQPGLLLQAACWVHVVTTYIVELRICVGPSMLPTINAKGDVLLTEYITPRLKKLQRGDVVIAVSPSDENKAICKRIVGMGGDRVCTNPESGRPRFTTVPRGHVWLQGDNLANSTDSRVYGAVPLGLVRARVLCKMWPPNECRVMHRNETDVMRYHEPVPDSTA